MPRQNRPECPDCSADLSRRDFVRLAGSAALAAGAVPLFSGASRAFAAPTSSSPAETAAQRFYASLSDAQKGTICMPWEHEKRQTINANWAITEPKIDDDFYSDEQRGMIKEVFRGLTSEDGYERFMKQTEFDDGGFGQYHVACFGTPGTGKFEFEVTGRHLTARCDGDSVEGAAFGGPIVYGHGEEDPAENLFHYQTKAANEVFKALDGKQREAALVEKAPQEARVPLQGNRGRFPGISVSELSADQRGLVEKVVKVLLAPYREADVEEAMAILKEGGDFDKLHMAFYKQGDLNNDQVWDIWRVEGPTFVWHFRGAPHVHTYVNIARKA